MSESAAPIPDLFDIPVAHLVTEDDTPVDNFFQDKQARLLADALDTSWPEGRTFISACDVGIFATNHEGAIVPDMFLSIGVSFPQDIMEKKHRSYFIWQFGKPPEVVIEIVFNRDGGEDSSKLERYARIKVPYYVIFDPDHLLTQRQLRIKQLSGASYVDKLDTWFPELGLGLTVVPGIYDGLEGQWLRWCQQNGTPLLTGKEATAIQTQRADNEARRADLERQHRLLLEARLRELGESI